MDDASCRQFAPALRRALYNEAVHRGWIRPGAELRLDVRRACDLFGISTRITPPSLAQGKRVLRILVWLRDHPDPAWTTSHNETRDELHLYLQPAPSTPGDSP